MGPEELIMDLLYWMKGEGLRPTFYRRNDRILNPYTRKISGSRFIGSHQKKIGLWIPTFRGLKPKLPDLRMSKNSDLYFATSAGEYGTGFGESEALLSLMQALRLKPNAH